MPRKALGRSLAFLLASLALHGAVLLAALNWIYRASRPPLISFASGDNGVEASLQRITFRVRPAVAPTAPTLDLVPRLPGPVPAGPSCPAEAPAPPPSPTARVQEPPPPETRVAGPPALRLQPSPERSDELRGPPPDALLQGALALAELPLPGIRGGSTPARRRGTLVCEYPESCRWRRHAGVVLLECDVDAAGIVRSARVLQSSGCREMDEAARKALLAGRFEPAMEGGQPVAARLRQPVQFVLDAAPRA